MQSPTDPAHENVVTLQQMGELFGTQCPSAEFLEDVFLSDFRDTQHLYEGEHSCKNPICRPHFQGYG